MERRPALPDKQWAEHEITHRFHRQLCPDDVAAEILLRGAQDSRAESPEREVWDDRETLSTGLPSESARSVGR